MNEGRHFSISVRADERDALVTVVDDGAGIANELLSRAFELVLARRFAERAYSARIPRVPARRGEGMPPPTYRSVPRRRILVVDGDVAAAERLGILLRQLGHDVQVAHDGHAAIETARINRPQLVLLDLGMTGIDGYRVVERLRQDARLAQVRFIAVARSGDENARRRSLEAGFAQHLVKPLHLEELRSLLEQP